MMCTTSGLDTTTLDAYKSSFSWKQDGGMVETVAGLHMQLVALAFACNYNRVATLQWGDGTDGNKYNTPSSCMLSSWTFHQLSHRVMSDWGHRQQPDRRAGAPRDRHRAHADPGEGAGRVRRPGPPETAPRS